MVQNEFHFSSADGKTSIHAVEWLPEGPVRAVLQISHGVCEYILRYAPLAACLTERGFAVAGSDHLGHGSSVAEGARRLYFGPDGSWNWVVEDLHTLRELEGRKFPGISFFLLGHSMGSFLARTYLIRYPGTLDGAILMGTGQMPLPVLAVGKAVAALMAKRTGEDMPHPLVEHLAFGTYNRTFAPNRTAYDWLSASEANVDRYIADPLCGGSPSTGLFREMLGGMAFIEKAKNLRKMDPRTPILFLSGEMDPVGSCGRGVSAACKSFVQAGVTDVTQKLYPGLRHEILCEACRETVFDDIIQWLQSHINQ